MTRSYRRRDSERKEAKQIDGMQETVTGSLQSRDRKNAYQLRRKCMEGWRREVGAGCHPTSSPSALLDPSLRPVDFPTTAFPATATTNHCEAE